MNTPPHTPKRKRPTPGLVTSLEVSGTDQGQIPRDYSKKVFGAAGSPQKLVESVAADERAASQSPRTLFANHFGALELGVDTNLTLGDCSTTGNDVEITSDHGRTAACTPDVAMHDAADEHPRPTDLANQSFVTSTSPPRKEISIEVPRLSTNGPPAGNGCGKSIQPGKRRGTVRGSRRDNPDDEAEGDDEIEFELLRRHKHPTCEPSFSSSPANLEASHPPSPTKHYRPIKQPKTKRPKSPPPPTGIAPISPVAKFLPADDSSQHSLPSSSDTGEDTAASNRPAEVNDLTWHDSEITGHLGLDPEDDGTGINGVGFRPTPQQTYARMQKRKQQVREWRERESREERKRRSERRRRDGSGVGKVAAAGLESVEDDGDGEERGRRVVRFA